MKTPKQQLSEIKFALDDAKVWKTWQGKRMSLPDRVYWLLANRMLLERQLNACRIKKSDI